MFHPVGSQPPSVYWRRRLVLLASVIALLALLGLTVRVLLSDDPGKPKAAGGTGTTTGSPTGAGTSNRPSPTPGSTTPHTSTSAHRTSGSPRSSKSNSSSPSASHSTSVPPKACVVSALGLKAATEKSAYQVGDQPVLSILVTNKSSTPCVQDLADPQIVLRVYNGESRVWGSHDCKIVPGTDERTLMGNSSVRVSITWTGLSSQPKCAGTRQRVGAGTYTLYASLAGREGVATQFTIS